MDGRLYLLHAYFVLDIKSTVVFMKNSDIKLCLLEHNNIVGILQRKEG